MTKKRVRTCILKISVLSQPQLLDTFVQEELAYPDGHLYKEHDASGKVKRRLLSAKGGLMMGTKKVGSSLQPAQESQINYTLFGFFDK